MPPAVKNNLSKYSDITIDHNRKGKYYDKHDLVFQQNIIDKFKMKHGIDIAHVSFYKAISKKLENKSRDRNRSIFLKNSHFYKLNNEYIENVYDDFNEKRLEEEQDRIESKREMIRDMAREQYIMDKRCRDW